METSALLQKNLYEWITVFKNGRTSVTGAEQSGCQSTAITGENIE
jgi:hypothetical protein